MSESDAWGVPSELSRSFVVVVFVFVLFTHFILVQFSSKQFSLVRACSYAESKTEKGQSAYELS